MVPHRVAHPTRGTPTTGLHAFLEVRSSEWGSLWLEGEPVEDCAGLLDSSPTLPEISASIVRKASASFKLNTDVRDGFHPRHFALLSHRVTLACISLVSMMEATGMFPSVLCENTVALIDKPGGGDRPIGLLRSFVRVWYRIRKKQLAEWERSHGSAAYFSATKGRSATDAVWRRATRCEIQASDKGSLASVLIDLRKCYDHIMWCSLAAESLAVGFPGVILRMSLAVYAFPRRLTRFGAVGRIINPNRFIIAGTTAATSELKLLLCKLLQRIEFNHPYALWFFCR